MFNNIEDQNKRGDEEPVCGGTTENFDPSAKREIVSDDVTYFAVESRYSSDPDDIAFISAFAAPAGNGCFVHSATSDGLWFEEIKTGFALIKDDVMKELASFARRHSLAAENGRHTFTHGLPENFGGSIDIRYASGEYISISDNTAPVITGEAGAELAALFADYCGREQVELPDPEDIRSVVFYERRKDGGHTEARLELSADGTGKNIKDSKYEPGSVYHSEKEVDAATVSSIKKIIKESALFARALLPVKKYAGLSEKTLTFGFSDGSVLTVQSDSINPGGLPDGFFAIELEMTVKH